MDAVVFTYTLCAAYIKSGTYDNLVLAINELNSIPPNMVSRLPAIKYLLAVACHKLNRFKIAEEKLEELHSTLKKDVVTLESYFYPGTDVIIPETQLENLLAESKKLESDCRLTQHNPVAVCRFESCSDLSSHIYPSKYIFSNDPDFSGYIVVVCQEKCDVEYHVNCWKAYKESKVTGSTGRVSDRDFLGQPCPTMDCVLNDGSHSPIIKIDLYDSQGSIKHSAAVDVAKLKLEAAKKKEREKLEKEKEKIEKMEREKQEKEKAKIEKSKSTDKVTAQKKTAPEDLNKTKSQKTPVKKPKQANVEKQKSSNKLTFSLDNAEKLEKKRVDEEIELAVCKDRIGTLRHLWQTQHYVDPSVPQIIDPDFPSELQYQETENAEIKTFIYSMFKEMFQAEGPQRVVDVQQKWDHSVEFQDVKKMLKKSENVCDVLLVSNDFFIIEDMMALQCQLPEVYNQVKDVTLESLRFMQGALFKPKEDSASKVDKSSDPFRFLPALNDPLIFNGSDKNSKSLKSTSDQKVNAAQPRSVESKKEDETVIFDSNCNKNKNLSANEKATSKSEQAEASKQDNNSSVLLKTLNKIADRVKPSETVASKNSSRVKLVLDKIHDVKASKVQKGNPVTAVENKVVDTNVPKLSKSDPLQALSSNLIELVSESFQKVSTAANKPVDSSVSHNNVELKRETERECTINLNSLEGDNLSPKVDENEEFYECEPSLNNPLQNELAGRNIGSVGEDEVAPECSTNTSNQSNKLDHTKKLTELECEPIVLPNNQVLRFCNGTSIGVILKEMEKIQRFMHNDYETNEINLQMLNELVNNFLSKFVGNEIEKLKTESGSKILFKKKVKLCLNISKKVNQIIMEKCMDMMDTIHSFGGTFIKRYSDLAENLDNLSCDNYMPLKTILNSTCSILDTSAISAGDFFFKKPKSIESSHVGCQTSTSDFLDSEVQTDSPSLQPAETESGETKLLFDHVRTQNDMILKFCNDYSSLMPPIISENCEEMVVGNNSFERNSKDQGSLLALNAVLIKSVFTAFEVNSQKFKTTVDSMLEDLQTNQMDFIFNLLRSRYKEKVADYEAFLKKFCTNSSRNLDCWAEIQDNIEHCRKMLHQLDYKENVFKLKLAKLKSQLLESGAVSVEDVRDLLALDFEPDPELNLKVSTIHQVFVSLLKAAANEFQRQNHKFLLKVLLQARDANLSLSDLTTQILAQQRNQNRSDPRSDQSTCSTESDRENTGASSDGKISTRHSRSNSVVSQSEGEVSEREENSQNFTTSKKSDENFRQAVQGQVHEPRTPVVSCGSSSQNAQPKLSNSEISHGAISSGKVSGDTIPESKIKTPVSTVQTNISSHPSASGNTTLSRCDANEHLIAKTESEKTGSASSSETLKKASIQHVGDYSLTQVNDALTVAEINSVDPSTPAKLDRKLLEDTVKQTLIETLSEKLVTNPTSLLPQSIASVSDLEISHKSSSNNVSKVPSETPNAQPSILEDKKAFEEAMRQIAKRLVENVPEKSSGKPPVNHVNQNSPPASSKPPSFLPPSDSAKNSKPQSETRNALPPCIPSLSKIAIENSVQNTRKRGAEKLLEVFETKLKSNPADLNPPPLPSKTPSSEYHSSSSSINKLGQCAPPYQFAPQFAPPNQFAPQFAPPNQFAPQFAPPNQFAPQFAPPNQFVPQFAPPSIPSNQKDFVPPVQRHANVIPADQCTFVSKPTTSAQKVPPVGKAPPHQTPVKLPTFPAENAHPSTNPVPMTQQKCVSSSAVKSNGTVKSSVNAASQNVSQTASKANQPKKKTDTNLQPPGPSRVESKLLSSLKDGCFKKLMLSLKQKYPKKSDVELILYLKSAREMNGEQLTGMSFNEIIALVDSMIETPNFKFPKLSGSGSNGAKPSTSVMGLEKFGQSAWVKKEERLSNYSNEDLKECVVCCCKMARNTTTTLTCKHVFHTHCIREWLRIKCVCPLCQAVCLMPDEYPSLR
nr:PREDICTED: uncharacterized protein LOC109043303 isoform X1 [Bemisia tabaci]